VDGPSFYTYLAASALDLVGMAHRLLDHCPAKLSGGEEQRGAVTKRPKVFLCDGHTAALDSTNGRLTKLVISITDI